MEEEDTCMSYEEEDTCVKEFGHLLSKRVKSSLPPPPPTFLSVTGVLLFPLFPLTTVTPLALWSSANGAGGGTEVLGTRWKHRNILAIHTNLGGGVGADVI
jgi:hypothetical protein